MWRHRHSCGVPDVVGTVVVHEAPGADQRALPLREGTPHEHRARAAERDLARGEDLDVEIGGALGADQFVRIALEIAHAASVPGRTVRCHGWCGGESWVRHPESEEHTSELQSLMRISYAVFCLKKKNNKQNHIEIRHEAKTAHRQ